MVPLIYKYHIISTYLLGEKVYVSTYFYHKTNIREGYMLKRKELQELKSFFELDKAIEIIDNRDINNVFFRYSFSILGGVTIHNDLAYFNQSFNGKYTDLINVFSNGNKYVIEYDNSLNANQLDYILSELVRVDLDKFKSIIDEYFSKLYWFVKLFNSSDGRLCPSIDFNLSCIEDQKVTYPVIDSLQQINNLNHDERL